MIAMRLVLLLLTLSAAAPAASRTIPVDEAVQLAIARGTPVRAARARGEAAHAFADSLRGRMLFGVRVNDEQQHFDAPFTIALLPGVPGATVRNENTNTFSAGAAQPLLGLLRLSQEHGALSAQADAAESSVKAAENSVREQMQTGFLRLFEARALAETARASQQQLGEQVNAAKAREHAGAGTTADVLRVQVAVANARQQELQAVAQEETARAGLLIAIGLSPADGTVDFAEPTALENEVAADQDQTAAIQHAFELRPEVSAARLLSHAADLHARSALLSLLPELNLEAGYSHIHGSLLAPIDSAFIGLVASWNVFEWGATYYQRKAAAAEALAASAEAQGTQDRIGFEVSSRLSQVRAAGSALDVGKATIASAEEAFRVTGAGVRAGVATTTDLLDAQSALTQARLNLVRARYELSLARVGLRAATGD